MEKPRELSSIDYPKVRLTINGEEKIFEVRYRSYDIVRLKKEHEIDLLSTEPVTVKGADALDRLHILLQAGIAHEAEVSLDDIAKSIAFADFPIYTDAIRTAQKKAFEEIGRTVEALGLIQKPPVTEELKPAIQ